ncbi:hypothetical protein PE36_01892 [Moritella sp. PE36]|uniref:restriction endonuclease n=1 Tax=Moritella sp. PE36 TaxID=58051 RepID=UPI0001568463|nr:restriction endonuclease [Moritella sp. PE36]EDM68693.1 hypothetical protein PE36_01892 [Moritella sp. PE36]
MEIKINDILRYKKPACHENAYEDGHLNFHFLTNVPTSKKLQLEKGINPSAALKTSDKELVRPVILISSSPNKKGSAETPWQDFYDTDNGHIRYFGDNKEPGKDPTQAPGNKALLEAFRLAHSHDIKERQKTPPIVFFKRVTVNGVPKGYPMFQGLGIINSIELVTQWDNNKQQSFTNYAFDFTVLCMAKEHDTFEWDWINSRRHPNFSIQDTNKKAPASWNQWFKSGANELNTVRRRVSKLQIVKSADQKPTIGSEQDAILNKIYKFYDGRKHHFEALAEFITERVIGKELGIYHKGWITQGSSDGGADFIGKVVLGSGFSKVELIVLGQAKCESLTTPTGGNHIARTVARLKRGWLGAYVTTSYFSDSVQREVIEDKYPILLINGKRIAEEVSQLLHESDTYSDIDEFLAYMAERYPKRLKQRQPEEILHV